MIRRRPVIPRGGRRDPAEVFDRRDRLRELHSELKGHGVDPCLVGKVGLNRVLILVAEGLVCLRRRFFAHHQQVAVFGSAVEPRGADGQGHLHEIIAAKRAVTVDKPKISLQGLNR